MLVFRLMIAATSLISGCSAARLLRRLAHHIDSSFFVLCLCLFLSVSLFGSFSLTRLLELVQFYVPVGQKHTDSVARLFV